MKLSQIEYQLPKELIAQEPAERRDHSQLMVIDRKTQEISHKYFYDILDLLTTNDVLVFNQSKVFPARLIGSKETGGKVEILLLENINKDTNEWSAMRGGKIKVGQILVFGNIKGIITNLDNSLINIQFNVPEEDLFAYIKMHGFTPLPPYIKGSSEESEIRKKYQTVYANTVGSVAAPTAGLHFTQKLLEKLHQKGVQMEYVTLHIGLGTFLPVKEEDITKHTMHTEKFSVDASTLDRLNTAKKEGKRIISVGTTTTRVLESLAHEDGLLDETTTEGATNIYIYPPYKFKFVDSLITNFHLPHSTLLALVSAFVSSPNTQEEFEDFTSSLMGKAYKEAIDNNYRFFSFGDASLII